MRLEGRVALVAGASRGIGEAIVRLFAAEGARVVFCARREELGRTIEGDLRERGHEVRFVQADVTDEEAVKNLMTATKEIYDGLDVLVTCAGIAPAAPIESMELAAWQELMNVNVTGMFLLTKHAIPLLRESDHAAIITLGSTFGHVGAGGSAGYAVTKAAAINFAKSAALELAGDGVRVNSLCPGGTETEFLQEWFESTGDAAGTEKWLVDAHPLGRLGTPEDQARAALFLASDDASFVTGHGLLVDGGYTAR
ncbi:MAG: SDR family oxidoreductase [Actinobacteria bacterium]|nr:SDR family oxidoreductase [Actinomycetota bacterium]